MRNCIRHFLFLALLCLTQVTLAQTEPAAPGYDLVVVEGTPGGIATAVRAAREGLRVLLVNRTAHLGGILASGLGVWDTLHEGRRSPVYDEVRQAILDHYRLTFGPDSAQYKAALPGKSGHTNGRFEPHVAERILTDLVACEKNITVLKGYVPVQVFREGRSLTAILLRETEGQRTRRIPAAFFADCTYEGDLLPLVGVAFRVGRESRTEFGEPHAGRIYMRPSKTPPSPEAAELAARHDRLNLRKFTGFQEIILPESTGEGDSHVQAFNFRTLLTSDPANRLPVEKPAGYDPAFLATLEFGSIVSPLPNQKIGWNRPQLVGPHQAYVEGSWEVRKKVMDQHWQATLGLLYYLQNDPAVPEARRKFFSAYGLAKDEFADNGHRPHEIYVREARRLTGRYIITQHDLMLAKDTDRAPIHTDSIAFAEWYMDTHACTPGKVADSLDEGKMMLHHETFPAHVPYRSLLAPDLDNLLVPVCLSATHVAWGAIRLEPAWMQIGEAAGLAFALAKQAQVVPASVDTRLLVSALAARHSMISFFNDVDISQTGTAVLAAQVFAVRGFFHDYNARLDEPLKEATARLWLQSLQAGPQDDASAQKAAQAMARAESGDSAAVSPDRWKGLLSEAGLDAGKPTQTGFVTRGQALEALWESLQ